MSYSHRNKMRGWIGGLMGFPQGKRLVRKYSSDNIGLIVLNEVL